MHRLLSISLIALSLPLPRSGHSQVVPIESEATDVEIGDDELPSAERNPYKPRFIAVPVAGYTPDTSVIFAGLGMLQFRPRSNSPAARASTVSIAASYTLRQQWLIGVDPSIYLDDERIWIQGRTLVQNWNSDYFGIGPDSRLDDEEEYVPRRVEVQGTFRHAVLDPRLYVGGGYSLSYVDMRETEDGGLLETDRPTGLTGGLLSGPTLSISWDDRDNGFYPYRGTFITARLQLNNGAFGSDFDSVTGTIDARGYANLGRRAKHILAGRAYLEFTAGDAPFYSLASLGGSQLMRGMTSGRLRDHNAVAVELEYRTPLIGRLGFVTFSGLGEVFGRFATLQASPRWTAGAGVRLQVDQTNRVNVRLDYGVSREELRGVYFSVTEAF